ncbi:uncharacterized protein [Miscanthus floridulus]|uniref:uncharacterized protein n=1 Tax=Miscanthus floridulus TaxID=154761 RepID=UPI00345AACE0
MAAVGERGGCATADAGSGWAPAPAGRPQRPGESERAQSLEAANELLQLLRRTSDLAQSRPTMASPSDINPSPVGSAPTIGLSSTASTGQQSNDTIAEASDPAWKHCTMPDVNKKNSLKCNYCGKTYHGGITRIKYHLGKVPKCGAAKCTKVPSDVQEEMIKLLSKKLDNKQRKNRKKEEDRAEVDLSHSEGEERSDADGNSVIVLKKVTSKGASSGGPMDKYRKLTPEEIVAVRKGKSGVAEKVQSKLSTEKREEKRDRTWVQNIVQVVTDNARPNEAAASLLKAKHPSIFWNGCAAHTIDLMLEDIGKMPRVAATISKAKCLTIFLYAHTRVLSLTRKFLSRDLVRCGVTRFATAYLNLKSLLENKKQLQMLFREDELNELGYLNSVKGKKANKVMRSETFWKGVETVVNYFEPLATVLRRMDSDVPAMGFLYGSLVEAKNEISRRFNNDRNKFEEVFHVIDKRWDSKLKTPLHRAGYYLNPFYYYQNKLAIEENESFRDGVITCITKLVPNEDTQDKIIEELQLFQDAEGSFGKEIAKRQCKNINFDPAKWWLNHGSSTPNLRKLAVHTKRRNRLLHDRMRDLMFVKFNSKLRQKKDKDKDPIEKHIVDALEDEDNEWITSIEPTEVDPEQEGEETGASSQGVAAAPQGQEKRKGGNLQKHRDMKRKRLIPTIEDGELSASSSDGEDDNDMPSDDSSDSEAK